MVADTNAKGHAEAVARKAQTAALHATSDSLRSVLTDELAADITAKGHAEAVVRKEKKAVLQATLDSRRRESSIHELNDYERNPTIALQRLYKSNEVHLYQHDMDTDFLDEISPAEKANAASNYLHDMNPKQTIYACGSCGILVFPKNF